MVSIRLDFRPSRAGGDAGKESMLFGYMEQMATGYLDHGRFRTGETYLTTLNSFRRFRAGKDIFISEMSSDLISAYANYLKCNGLSHNTAAFYLKHLRAVYNHAVNDGLTIDRKPFRYVSTSIEKTVKRALPLAVLKQIKLLDCSDRPAYQFARDIFLFSFYTRGMSFVDIAYLQKKNLNGNMLSYRRKKTGQHLSMSWEPCMQEILDRYPSDPSSPYLLSIIRDTGSDARREYQNAMFRVNRNLKEIGRGLKLAQPLTMYCARHSWASIAKAEGIPLAVISEGMGHDSEKTTQIYLTSLETEVVDQANRRILSLL